MPRALKDLYFQIIDAINHQESVVIVYESRALSTQEAADLLGISRQFLIRLLERGALPFHLAGTHRRIYQRDVLDYMKIRRKNGNGINGSEETPT